MELRVVLGCLLRDQTKALVTSWNGKAAMLLDCIAPEQPIRAHGS